MPASPTRDHNALDIVLGSFSEYIARPSFWTEIGPHRPSASNSRSASRRSTAHSEPILDQ